MELQYYALTIFLIWLPISAIAAFAGRQLGSWALGRSAGILLLVLLFFFIEHFIGLGPLKWGWLLCIPAAAYLWKKWPELKGSGFLGSEAVFAAAFAYGMIWKICLPAIYPTAERLTDMVFVGNYYKGTALPPIDNWYPPFHFDFYYALQHYGAALMGRAFNLPLGLATNIAFVLLMALPITLAWDIAGRFVSKRWPKVLLAAALACGGTGASIFAPLIFQAGSDLGPQANSSVINGRMWGSARFIGQYDQLANTPLGNALIAKQSIDDPSFRNLPLENFGYQYYIGDYHPPIGGFFLLLLAIALMVSLEKQSDAQGRRSTALRFALTGLTVPATIATNTWVFPLHAAMVGSWALWRQYMSRSDVSKAVEWKALVGGGIAGFMLLYPFLTGFADRTSDTPLSLVTSHTPFMPFVMQLWPLLILIALAIFHRDSPGVAFYFGLMFLGLLVFTEFFFIDDPSVGQYQRTNSVMKWWGWIWTGGLVVLGAASLGSKRAWVRAATALSLAGTLVYAIYTFNYLTDTTNPSMAGRMRGDIVYTRDMPVRGMFQYLAAAPDGIVLENQYTEAYHDGGAYAAFAAKPLLLGWPAHIVTWRGRVQEAMQRRDEIRAFYAGTLENPVAWLEAHDVRYVVWNQRDAAVPDAWQRLHGLLEGEYAWHSFGTMNGREVGLWVRRM